METYDIIVPVKTSHLNAEEKKNCLNLLQEYGIHRILLTLEPLTYGIYRELADDIAFFTENGIEVMVWYGETMGHGVALAGQLRTSTPRFTPIVNPKGEGAVFAFCPLDPKFQAFVLENIRTIVKAGAKGILLDDDYRLSNRSYGIGCGCSYHRAEIALRLGREVDSDTLNAAVLHGDPNPIRDAWYQAQGDSLRSFSARIRQAVDEIDPTVRVGLCGGQSTWDTDGVSAAELAEILAGDTRPFLRLCGAPYWAWRQNPVMTGVFEITSMYRSFCHNPDMELVAEGDVYPRPRYNCPASYSELFDAFIRASGDYNGNMKYILDYYSVPKYETGYLRLHKRNLPRMAEWEAFFHDGIRTGVRVYETMEKFRQAWLPGEDFDPHVLSSTPYPHGGCMLAACGIPTTYEGDGLCGLAFGENARYLEDDALESGLILDASAARILTQRGVDVGLRRELSFAITYPNIEHFETTSVMIDMGVMRYLEAELAPNVCIESTIEKNGIRCPLSYRYENQNGQRFLVYLFDSLELPRNSGWLFSYERQKQLYQAVTWLSGTVLPAYIGNNPYVYSLMKRDGDTITLGFFNCFADWILSPCIVLDEAYRVDTYCQTSGREEEGKLILDDIPPFDFVGISIQKKEKGMAT